ncbi:PDZ domain-containing protein [bacterium]|nr:PDZ domain-containing protein [bacterium]
MGGVSCAHAAAEPAAAKPKNTKETFALLQLFGDVYERVKEDYVEDVPDEKLVHSAINGMLTSLDPHSSFLDKEGFKDIQVQTKGEFGGLGIEVTMENGLVKVVSPIDDTPAAKVGIKAQDYISHIDNEPVMGLTLSDAVEKMRGKVGSKVKLTVLREGADKPLDFELTRAVIKIQSVRSRREGDVAYIRVTSFSEQATSGTEEAFEKLKKEIGPDKIRGVVLDLRNNPGGLLDQAIGLSDLFLEKGEVVSTRGRTEDSNKRFFAREGDITGGLPIVVLVNGGSASASEIVSGALQDHKRAVIMGTKSFGKGSVQTVIPIPNHGAIRLTTSRYYTPSGRSIQAEGIQPDIIVEPSKVVPLEQLDMRSEADLPNHLSKPKEMLEKAKQMMEKAKDAMPGKDEAKPENGEVSKDKKDPLKTDNKSEVKPANASEDDYQLQRALDFITGVSFYKTFTSSEKPSVKPEPAKDAAAKPATAK